VDGFSDEYTPFSETIPFPEDWSDEEYLSLLAALADYEAWLDEMAKQAKAEEEEAQAEEEAFQEDEWKRRLYYALVHRDLGRKEYRSLLERGHHIRIQEQWAELSDLENALCELATRWRAADPQREGYDRIGRDLVHQYRELLEIATGELDWDELKQVRTAFAIIRETLEGGDAYPLL
jgi:hypothetical protein